MRVNLETARLNNVVYLLHKKKEILINQGCLKIKHFIKLRGLS